MGEWQLDLDGLFHAVWKRHTGGWMDDMALISYRRDRLVVIIGIVTAGVYVLLGMSAAGFLFMAVAGTPLWLPVALFLLTGVLILIRGRLCSKGLLDLLDQTKVLVREKAECLTVVGFVSFNDLPGYFLAVARGKGGFLAWQWGTELDLKQGLGVKLEGRLLHTGIQTALVSGYKLAQQALDHFVSSLAAALGEKYIPLPPEVCQEIDWTAQMLEDALAQSG